MPRCLNLLRSAALCCSAVVFLASPAAAEAASAAGGPAISAQSAVLIDVNSGRVLYERNADEKRLIASTTKIMTAFLALKTANPDDKTTVKHEHTLVEGTRVYFKAGDVLTVRELLIGTLLQSGNDAALALADHCGGDGGVAAFVTKMNALALQLGMTNTRFANPHGLNDDNHYSTARDMGILAAAALSDPAFEAICSMKTGQVGQITVKNHNRLLWDYDGAIGVKTGYTRKAGRCLVSGAQRNGQKLAAVTLNAPSDWKDHADMLDMGFEKYPERRLCTQDAFVCELPVVSGERAAVDIRVSQTLAMPLSDDEARRVTVSIELPRFAWAPVGQRQTLGRARYMLDGETIAVCELYAEQDAARAKARWRLPFLITRGGADVNRAA
ncbi:MAG: D-alanyl-D-alanine carboxypeptidase [Oscillospiraceae bacterium]|nr:D-alanyl-D-alanine carboxypeptidase [Oscillospiraceae bacterium]